MMKRVGLFGVALAGWINAVTAAPAKANSCCEAIAAVLPGKVIFQTDNDAYVRIKKSFWSAQNTEIDPGCFFQPLNAQDVSVAIKILNQPSRMESQECKFAIRSGGHTVYAGASTIQGGVTFDLSGMKGLKVSNDKSIVSVEPGNRWLEVYNRIEPLGIAVSGGRWGNVGVGGLLTGGGLSFFQGREGPACDGILNHEVVLSDGSIVEANSRNNSDLHKALKGGNNNFGIVTRFDLKAFPQEHMWGGTIVDTPRQGTSALEWFQTFTNSSENFDPNGMAMFSPVSALGYTIGSAFVTYAKPDLKPPPFKKFYDGSLMAMTGITTYPNMALMNALGTPSGGRSAWASFTFKNSAAFTKVVMDLAVEKGAGLPLFGAGFMLIFQSFWHASRAKSFAATGGNALGLEDTKDDLVIVLVSTGWLAPSDDQVVRSKMKDFVETAMKKAKEMGVYSPYIYANYADGFQDVMGGYGEKSRAELIATSKKYDPIQLFQKQVPGGFKLVHKDR